MSAPIKKIWLHELPAGSSPAAPPQESVMLPANLSHELLHESGRRNAPVSATPVLLSIVVVCDTDGPSISKDVVVGVTLLMNGPAKSQEPC